MKEIFATLLVVVSALTALTVECIKKILDEQGKTYKPNLLAGIVAVILSVATIILWVVYTGAIVDGQLISSGIALTFLSFLCSMVGYDKVIQTINQIVGGNGGN